MKNAFGKGKFLDGVYLACCVYAGYSFALAAWGFEHMLQAVGQQADPGILVEYGAIACGFLVLGIAYYRHDFIAHKIAVGLSAPMAAYGLWMFLFSSHVMSWSGAFTGEMIATGTVVSALLVVLGVIAAVQWMTGCR